MDMRFGTGNIRTLYRADSLMTVSRELAKYKLDLVGEQEVHFQIKNGETGGDCSIHVKKSKCITNFDSKNLKERDHLEDRGMDLKIIFR
jgi:hypothetical protein